MPARLASMPCPSLMWKRQVHKIYGRPNIYRSKIKKFSEVLENNIRLIKINYKCQILESLRNEPLSRRI
jgi:hypothetical protein